MADFLFYKSDNVISMPDSFRKVYEGKSNCTIYQTGKEKSLHKIETAAVTFILFGNFYFLRGYELNPGSFIQYQRIDKDAIDNLFRKVRGTYGCLIHDKCNHLVYVISDPLGFYPLYYYNDEKSCIFSSEIKYFKFFPHADCSYNAAALHSYLYNGHLISNQSWFQQVSRTRPASIYTCDLSTGKLFSEYYWTWEKVKKQYKRKNELIDQYASLFRKGILDLEFASNTNPGISLSGGLDSRWIAKIVSENFHAEAFTFSTGNNRETKIARRVADSLHLSHRVHYIKKEKWLKERLPAFWKTDGLLHLGHLHEGNIYREVHENYTACFHGLFGGGIYAGQRECNQRINHKIAKRHFDFHGEEPPTSDVYYNTYSIDPFIADQKLRYQSAYSIYLLSNYTTMVLPFYNPDWLELNYSIDDYFQVHSKFYLEVLQRQLNDDLLKIPWQRTGIAPRHIWLNTFSQKYKLPQIGEYLSQRIHRSRHFINYNIFDAEINTWIREFDKDIMTLGMDYPLNSRERKFRMLSLIVILRMLDKNSPDVI